MVPFTMYSNVLNKRSLFSVFGAPFAGLPLDPVMASTSISVRYSLFEGKSGRSCSFEGGPFVGSNSVRRTVCFKSNYGKLPSSRSRPLLSYFIACE